MNQVATQQHSVVSTSQVGIGSKHGAKIAPQNLAEVMKFAEVMCRADIALPKHLRGNQGACMAVAIQAMEWEMSPFSVAQKSYVVNGVIAFEAQLIAAVVNSRSGIQGRLRYSYEGSGDNLTCTITGKLEGEDYAYTSPPIGKITPKNSPLWKTDPEQQLGYYSSRAWARRYTPEVLAGVYDREEAESFQGPDNARDVTPAIPLSKRLAEANASNSGEGFSQEHVQAETAEFTEIQEQDDQSFGAESSSRDDEPAGDRLPPDSPAGDFDQTENTAPKQIDEPSILADLQRCLNEAPDKAAVNEVIKEFTADMGKLSDGGKATGRGMIQTRRAELDGGV